MKRKGYEKLDEIRKKLEAEEVFSMTNKFFGRRKELAELKAFIANEDKRTFCLYAIPMMGKTILTKEFCKTLEGYKIIRIRFTNPENPENELRKEFPDFIVNDSDSTLIVIENFEEALLLEADHEHLHEIQFPKVKEFVQTVFTQKNVKLILESRFFIRMPLDTQYAVARLSDIQLSKIDRNEAFKVLNNRYRNNTVQYADFEEMCEKFNDHIWLIEMAMQDEFEYRSVKEAMLRPQNITQKLWVIVERIIKSLSIADRKLLCAFGIMNPMHEATIKMQLLPAFAEKDELNESLFSLIRKLLLIHDPDISLYELNPFLREICFTYLKTENEMRNVEQIPFFKHAQKPRYNAALQAQEKGDYGTFYRLIHDMRKKGEYQKVHELLSHVRDNDPVINKMGVLNEIGVTYRWQENYPRAISVLEKALTIEPQNVKVINELAIVYKAQKNYPKAIEWLKKALNFDPKDIKTLNALGIVYSKQKDYSKAIEELKKALQIDPEHVQSINELAIVYKELKDYPKAIELLQAGCALRNVHSFNELAKIYKELGDYPKAIEVLNKVLLINSKDVKALKLLARVYQEQENYPMSAKIAADVLKIDPEDVFSKTILQSISKSNRPGKDIPSPIRNTISKDGAAKPLVVILTAIKEEYDAVRLHLKNLEDVEINDTVYEKGMFEYNNENIASVIIRECGARNTNAAQETERAINNFIPDYLLFVGIAGSRKPGDFQIGDVIFPEKIYSYEGGRSEKDSFRARPDLATSSYTLSEIAKRERGRNKWKKLIKGQWQSSVKANLGVIASGEQLVEHYNSEIGKILTQHFNDTQVVEMEGFGFAKAATRQGRHASHLLVGVVRGISDIIGQGIGSNTGNTTIADPRPTNNKKYASSTAAAFAFWLIYQACIKKSP